jgi:polyisoprenoid-binding protein YceI
MALTRLYSDRKPPKMTNQESIMTKIFLAFTALLFLCGTAMATEVDVAQSAITWKGSKITGDHHVGHISTKSSSLTLSDGVIAGGDIVFDMNSLTVNDLEGKWKDKFIGHMKSADFFDVANHPTARLKLNNIADGKATGTLTIKGVTQPISFAVKQVDQKYVGKTSFDRTKFGITFGSGSFFEDLGDKMINDAVEVEFTIALMGE